MAAVRRCGVRPCVGQRLEAGAGLGDRVEDVEEVARGSGETVKPSHHEHVPSPSRLRSLASSGRSVRAPLILSE